MSDGGGAYGEDTVDRGAAVLARERPHARPTSDVHKDVLKDATSQIAYSTAFDRS